MSGLLPEFTESDLPALYRSADRLSARGRARRRNFLIGLLLCDLGASFFSGFERHPRSLSTIALILLVGALLGTILLLEDRPETDWYRGRALAESVKTVTWRYMMRAQPYNSGLSDSEADRALVGEFGALLKVDRALSRGLNLGGGDDTQITNKMREVRSADVALRKDFYCHNRLRDQKAWYSRKGKSARKWQNMCRYGLIILQLGLVIEAISILEIPQQDFSGVGLLSTLAASLIAWQQLNEYGGLAIAYNLTSHELAGLDSLINRVTTESDLHEFVLNAERAISREHTMWRARRTE